MHRKRNKIAYIINPRAGASGKRHLLSQIRLYTPASFDYEIIPWRKPEEGAAITRRIVAEGFTIAVAVGGDGTVNEVSKALLDTAVTLAIIPTGSGNGLARHLNIPLDIRKAIELITLGNEQLIDSCSINGRPFFCTSGIGFDAHIGKLFSECRRRSFRMYAKITLLQLFHYKSAVYMLTVNKERIRRKAFLITFANASQYGNDACIAPGASVLDGLIDVCILKPFKIWNLPSIVWQIFHRTIDKSNFLETFRVSEIDVERENRGPAHFDGEPEIMDSLLRIRIRPHSLRVITPFA